MKTAKPQAFPSPNSNLASDLRDHGIPVFNGSPQSLTTTRDPINGKDYIHVGLNAAPTVIVQIDAKTGKYRQFTLPQGCSGPWGQAYTLDGDLLVTATDGQITRINPRTGKVWNVGHTRQWIWTIARGPDNKFYLGTTNVAGFWRFDAQTNKLEELHRFQDLDKMLRVVICQPDGYAYLSIGCTTSHIVAWHIATGTWKSILPKHEAGPDFHGMGCGEDGLVYVHSIHGNLYRLSHGQAFLQPKPDVKILPHGNRAGLFAPVRLADGRIVTRLDPDAIQIGQGDEAKIIKYKYTTSGAGLFHLAAGPKNTVVASSIMPLYLARFTPRSNKLENLGRAAPDNGEIYSFGVCCDKLYYANYSYGTLMVYDPSKPWHKDAPGQMQWKDNPKLISYLGPGHCRPRAMTVDSQQRVWVGSQPEYGRRNGGLFCHDTKTGKNHNNPVVIKDRSVQCLAADETRDVIYGGTDTTRGSGVDRAKGDAQLFAWDGAKQKMLWQQVAIPGCNGVMNLLCRDGKLYGSSRVKFTFFRFDIAARKMDYVIESKIDAVREISMTFGPDGNIYGITYTTLFRWNPQTGEIVSLWTTLEEELKNYSGGSLFHRGAVIIDGRYYFSCGPRIMSLKLP